MVDRSTILVKKTASSPLPDFDSKEEVNSSHSSKSEGFENCFGEGDCSLPVIKDVYLAAELWHPGGESGGSEVCFGDGDGVQK